MKNIKINKNEDKNNNMDFKELLNLVKNQENNKLNQDFSDIRNNDTVIFYDWSCICSSRKDINKVVEQLVKNHIYVYSLILEEGTEMYELAKQGK